MIKPTIGKRSENIAERVKKSLKENLNFFEKFSAEEVYEHRKNKFLKIGRNKGFSKSSNLSSKGLGYDETFFTKLSRHVYNKKYIYLGVGVVILTLIIAIFN